MWSADQVAPSDEEVGCRRAYRCCDAFALAGIPKLFVIRAFVSRSFLMVMVTMTRPMSEHSSFLRSLDGSSLMLMLFHSLVHWSVTTDAMVRERIKEEFQASCSALGMQHASMGEWVDVMSILIAVRLRQALP